MPSKYRIKAFTVGQVYHIYNRSPDEKEVFGESEEFDLFEKLLKRYLTAYTPEVNFRFKGEKPYRVRHKQDMVLAGQVELLAYCLMPDHFHLLLKEIEPGGITKLMRRVLTYYGMEYNRKRKRWGPVFFGTYRAVLIEGKELQAAVSRLIHLNPVVKSVRRFALLETISGSRMDEYRYSSFQDYVSPTGRGFVNTGEILEFFGGDNPAGRQAYKHYVENPAVKTNKAETLMLDLVI